MKKKLQEFRKGEKLKKKEKSNEENVKKPFYCSQTSNGSQN